MLLASTLGSGCGGESGTETAATAGKAAITDRQLEHWSTISERRSHRGPAEARARALDYLVVSAWVRAEAKRRHIWLGAGEAARRVESGRATFVGGPTSFDAALSGSGETRRDAIWQAEVELLYERLEKANRSRPAATVSAVAEFYRRHRRRFLIPERRFFLSDTRNSKIKALEDRTRALAGHPFPSRALHESLSRSEIGYGGAARKRIEQAIFAAPLGVPIGPFQNEPIEDYTLVQITRIVPARYRPLSEVRTQIEKTLNGAAEQEALDTFRRTWQLRWGRVTHCRHGVAAPACQGTRKLPLPLTL